MVRGNCGKGSTQIKVAGSKDLAYQRGTFVTGMLDAQGQVMKSTGKFVGVWKKHSGGNWQVIIDIDNADR